MHFEDPMSWIAMCLIIWTCGILFLLLALLLTLLSINAKVREVKAQVLPLVIRGQDMVGELKSLSKDVRKQVRKSEHLVKDTLSNVNETTTRIRDSIAGLSMILSALGRLMSPWGPSRKGKD